MLMNEDISEENCVLTLNGGEVRIGLGLRFVDLGIWGAAESSKETDFFGIRSLSVVSCSSSVIEVALVEIERSEFRDAASDARRRLNSLLPSDDVGEWNS